MITRRGRRRFLAPLLLAMLMVVSASAASADPDDRLDRINEKRQRIHEQRVAAEARIEDVLAEIRVLDARRARAEVRVARLDAELAVLDDRIGELAERLQDAQGRLAVLTAELLDLQVILVERTDLFTARARAAYIAGPEAHLDGLLSSDSFSQIVNRLYYHSAALDADAELIDEITVLRDDADARRAAVERTKLEIASAKLVLEADREAVANVRSARAAVLAEREFAISAKESLLAEIEARRDALAAAERQLEADAARIQGILQGGSSGAPSGHGQLLWPADGPVTSGYGWRTHPIFGDQRFHAGIDIGAGYGAPVWASDSGYVTYVGVMSGYGNVVVIDHGGGLATTYNHLSAFYVSSGEQVARGSNIAAVGCTGYCTGPHLHFEVRANGEPVDPMPYLQ